MVTAPIFLFHQKHQPRERRVSYRLGRWIARTVWRRRDAQEVLIVPEWMMYPCATPDKDPVIKALDLYDPKPTRLQQPKQPDVPEYPAKPGSELAPEAKEKAVLEELLAIHRKVKLPGQPLQFSSLSKPFEYPAVPEKPPHPDGPKAPSILPTPTDGPELRLPYYFIDTNGLPWWKWMLNGIVDLSNSAYRERLKQLKIGAGLEIEARNELNVQRQRAYQRARERRMAVVELMDREWKGFLSQYEDRKRMYDAAVDRYLSKLRELQAGLIAHRREETEEYFRVVLAALPLPESLPREAALRYDPETRIAVLDYSFPDLERLTFVRWTTNRSTIALRLAPTSDAQRRKAVDIAIPSSCLVLGRALADADEWDLLDAVCVNVYVDHIDRRTGQPKRSYVASMFATRPQLLALHMAEVDPIMCFAALKGKYARSALAYEPVEPIARIDMNDDRIVKGREVLGGLTEEANLAAMDWEDFEHLIRELFELEFGKDGSKVEITRASRDRGVDAIVFDPDPLRGGKYVIQAKRYTVTVDVSAVRDLYGTVVNEGANRGILVTTSHFGPDAYAFAKDKNLVLIPGPELLGLLQKHGYGFRIDIDEARRLARN
jgi:restriction system protein